MTNPFALPTTAPAPATATPVAPAPAIAPDVDPFGDPSAPLPKAPRFRELYGRLLLLVPKSIARDRVSRQFRDAAGNPLRQDTMTMDLIVLDGGPIHYGGRPEEVPPVPHTMVQEPPHRWVDVLDSHVGIISQCREALAARTAGRPGMVLGRLGKGVDSGTGSAPWLLSPATDADKAIARQYLASVDPFA